MVCFKFNEARYPEVHAQMKSSPVWCMHAYVSVWLSARLVELRRKSRTLGWRVVALGLGLYSITFIWTLILLCCVTFCYLLNHEVLCCSVDETCDTSCQYLCDFLKWQCSIACFVTVIDVHMYWNNDVFVLMWIFAKGPSYVEQLPWLWWYTHGYDS